MEREERGEGIYLQHLYRMWQVARQNCNFSIVSRTIACGETKAFVLKFITDIISHIAHVQDNTPYFKVIHRD